MPSLGERIRAYETIYDYTITNRLPVIIRLDGKGFSDFTKRYCVKPFDDKLADTMAATMLSLSDFVEDCVFGFTQSDEITLVLRNDRSLESQPWFGNRLQKLVSLTAAFATAAFNREFFKGAVDYTPALFDSRVFVVPSVDEAANVLIHRQQDCVKNSISTACYWEMGKKLGRKTACKLIHGKNSKERQEALFAATGLNWNDYLPKFKNGVACYKEVVEVNGAQRSKWKLDDRLPTFVSPKFDVGRIWLLERLNFPNKEM